MTGWCASSRWGSKCPSNNNAVPNPVPSVITISNPFSLTTPKPCISASFAIRTGLFNASLSNLFRFTPFHESVPRLGAVWTIPFFYITRESNRYLIIIQEGELLQYYERVKTPDPASPQKVLEVIQFMVSDFQDYDKISVGFPGYIKKGIVHLEQLNWEFVLA